MSDRYQITSELAFYVAGRPRTYNLPIDQRSNQYQVWGGMEELRGRDGLFVTFGNWGAPLAVYAACASVHPVEVVEITHGGQPVESFSIVRCQAFRGLSHEPNTG